MVKRLALALLAGLLAFVAYVAMQPSTGTVTRSATIPAPPSAVFPYVNDLHKWQEWSPWAKLDPNATTTFEGPEAGNGAAFSWSGNDEVGQGKMTIAESRQDTYVKMNLDFEKPFAGRSVTEFQLKPEGAGTNVVWSMTGERPFLVRAMCIILNGDRMVGEMFEKGLQNLAKVASPAPQP
jgi:uncharacterized protein YndB with AHSA1/START domain